MFYVKEGQKAIWFRPPSTNQSGYGYLAKRILTQTISFTILLYFERSKIRKHTHSSEKNSFYS